MNTSHPKQFVGIFMDHHSARIIDARTHASQIIHTNYESRLREKGQSPTGSKLGNFRSSNNEAGEHHQEQHDMRSYYKEIAEVILPYDEIYLFGPTTAKQEFQNFLLQDPHFNTKIIRVESSDYTTLNEQDAQIKNHFKSRL